MTKTLHRIGIAAATTVVAVAGAAMSTGSAQAASDTIHGCPRGAVCIYPKNKGWNGNRPESGGVFWSYGPHNLKGQYGNHYVLNNQTSTRPDLSVAAGCTRSNGGGKRSSQNFLLFPWVSATKHYQTTSGEHGFSWANVNLTPANSVVLTTPHGRDWCAFK